MESLFKFFNARNQRFFEYGNLHVSKKLQKYFSRNKFTRVNLSIAFDFQKFLLFWNLSYKSKFSFFFFFLKFPVFKVLFRECFQESEFGNCVCRVIKIVFSSNFINQFQVTHRNTDAHKHIRVIECKSN